MTAPVLSALPNKYPYYVLGALGRLVPIQCPIEGFSNPVTEYGILHTPLSGLQTKDVFGYKSSFQIPLDSLDARAWSFIEMMFRGAITGPYYLIDPRKRNRLSAFVSSNGATFTNTTGEFTPSSGTVAGVANTVSFTLPDAITGKVSQGPTPALAWTPSAAGTLLANAELIPVLPGETITFSCYIQAGNPTLEIVPYNATLTAGAPWTGTADVPGIPDRKYITRRIPLDGSVLAVRPQLRASAAGTYTTIGWQLSDSPTPEPWTLGSSVAKVLIDGTASGSSSGGADYPTPTMSGTLTLYEV